MVDSGALACSISYNAEHPFPLENIPFGIFANPKTGSPSAVTRIGDSVIDLGCLEAAKCFDGPLFSALTKSVFGESTLNSFMELGKDYRIEARHTLQKLFAAGASLSETTKNAIHASSFPADAVKLLMPVSVRDYTDFYSSKNHAFNVGCMFRDPNNALFPNWSHLPVGYHGRASSVVVSGTEVRRPRGQGTVDKLTPQWRACARLDYELEMGTYITKANPLGYPVKCKDARDHIFGYTLLNDWSARDLQVWEYVPLGPFLAKNFATTVSPWVITPEALEPFKTALPKQEPELLPYL